MTVIHTTILAADSVSDEGRQIIREFQVSGKLHLNCPRQSALYTRSHKQKVLFSCSAHKECFAGTKCVTGIHTFVLHSASESDNNSDSNNGNSDSTYTFSSTVDDSLSESDMSVDVPLVCMLKHLSGESQPENETSTHRIIDETNVVFPESFVQCGAVSTARVTSKSSAAYSTKSYECIVDDVVPLILGENCPNALIYQHNTLCIEIPRSSVWLHSVMVLLLERIFHRVPILVLQQPC